MQADCEEALVLDCEDPDAEQPTEAEAAWARFYRALRRIAFRRKRWGVEGQWLNALKCRANGRDHHLLK